MAGRSKEADRSEGKTGYEAQFRSVLGRFRSEFTLWSTEPVWGIDYYGSDLARKAVGALAPAERVEFVARLFLDALFDAALHASRHELDRALFLDPGCPVFVINSYNIINSPVTNLSHCAPQVLLGLFGDWDADAIDLLGPALAARLDTIRTRCRAAGVALEKVERFLADLAEDDDLFSIDFTSVGLGIPPKVRDTYLRVLAKG